MGSWAVKAVCNFHLIKTRDPARAKSDAENRVKKMERLSVREKKIFELLLDGHSTDDIAHDLNIDVKAVKADMREILRKVTAQSDGDGN
jgi:DNA-binding CsgD family transcriptional regulator